MVFATRHHRSDTGLSCNHPLIQAVQCCEYQILHRFYISCWLFLHLFDIVKTYYV